MTQTSEHQRETAVRPGAVTFASPAEPDRPAWSFRFGGHLALVAVGLGVLWAAPELRLAADFFLTFAFLLAVPPLALATAGAFLGDVTRVLGGRPARWGFGRKPLLAMFLCMVGMTVYTPPSFCSPVMLDLDGNGVIGTTGNSTARQRLDRQVGHTVSFDLAASGRPQQIEWSNGDGSGFLVDDRDGSVARTGRIDGSRLFGDQGGLYASGYDKLAGLDANRDGQLTGAELKGLAVWSDNGDARLQPGELQGVAALGIDAIGVAHHAEANARGEVLDRSWFAQRGRRKLTEDVWFGVAYGSR